MKKTLIFILMILVLMVSSCNLFLTEEYGELILSFDGSLPDGARALGPDGLPILSTTSMKIDIIREDGYMVTRELGAEEPKSLIELVPIGEKIEIIVTAINPSGQWSGRASHTVVSGQNHVRVLLNKNISGLKNLLFTQKKTNDLSTPYNLTFYMDGKEINAPDSGEEYSFARDSKGRLYVRYKPNDTYLARYTSEGKFFDRDMTSIDFLANDYTTGNMYGLSGSNINKIKEDLTLTSLPAPSPHVSAPFAVDNGIFTWATIGSSVIYLWKDSMAPPGVQGGFSLQTHAYNLGTNDGFAIKDIFIRNGYVYVLFAGVQSNISYGLYSLGAVLKWKIGTNPASGYPQFEGTPVVLGKSAGSPVIENGVLKNYDYSKNFYGAVKVIGFDEENIYIADDGFDAADTPAGARIVKNRNRIAALNIATNTLSFSDERTAKWYNEWKEWRTPNTKMIVWNSGGSSYYQVETGAENPLPTAFATVLTDVFCYDAAGNLYVAKKTPDEVHRFALKDDGSYNSDGNKSISVMPDAMAVSVSSVAANAGKTILFYYQKPFGSPFNHEIKRLAWDTDSFSSAALKTTITLSDLGQTDTVTALAANKDGIFVAVKTVTDKDSSNEKYKLTVKKYAHTPLSGGLTTVSGTATVVSETLTNYDLSDRNKYINENLNALYIKDGILYGLITKQKGYAPESNNSGSKEVFIGGKLIKIGETGASFGSPAVTLYERTGLTPETSGRFAPYRFIAIKPKKLVIASKGYYGKLINDDNPWNPITEKKTYKKVFVFDIGNWANPAETVTQADFSKKLDYCFGFMWN